MKSFYETVIDPNPKTAQKIQKALGNGYGGQFYNQFRDEFMAYMGRGDYADVNIVVTPNYICDYSGYNALFGGTIKIVPISFVKNVYRSNIINGEYSYDYFYLAIETLDNQVLYLTQIARGAKNSMELLDPVINAVRYETGKYYRTPQEMQ